MTGGGDRIAGEAIDLPENDADRRYAMAYGTTEAHKGDPGVVWQPDQSRSIAKREELRQAREREADGALDRARDLDADEVERRAQRRRREREAAQAPSVPDVADPGASG